MSENKDVENYRHLLKDLSHPAKPLITSLTNSLREHFLPQSQPALARLLAYNLKTSAYVIPALYLVDSVIKTLGASWIKALIEGGLVEAFVTAYRQCARPEDKKEMQRVFLTWKPSLLPETVLQAINEALSQSSSSLQKKRSIDTTNNYPSESSNEKRSKTVTPVSPILLNTAELSKLVQQIQPHKRLYSLPRQCANCGLRFPDTDAGKEAHRMHLDGHFRRKARLRQKTKRVLARDWFLPAAEWTASLFLPTNVTEQEHSDKSAYFANSETTSSKAGEVGDGVREEDAAMVPAGDDPQNASCAQCNESLLAVWDDESEQWVFRGAKLNSQGLVCHSSCL